MNAAAGLAPGPTGGAPALPLPETDAALVARIAEGDRAALAALYDRYEPVLLALARRLLHGAADAEDLVHDVCLEMWRQAHTYAPSVGSVRAWLVTRLRSRAIDRLRSARTVPLDAGTVREIVGSGPDASLQADCARVRCAVSGLPEGQRAVLELFYFEGLPCPEIAERLGIPTGTVKSRLSRALGQLRQGLRE